MKVRAKLICFFLLILLIPVLVVAFLATSSIRSSCLDFLLSSIENSVLNQADDINFICERIISETKNMVMNDSIRNYVSETLSEDFEIDTESDEYKAVLEEINYLDKYGENMMNAMIINSSGIVVASSSNNEEKIGRRISNYKEMFDGALQYNGFSGFSMSDESTNQSLVFSITRIIYSEDNSKVGIFYATYDSAFIQKYLNSMKMDKYTIVALMDRDGNMMEYPFKTVNDYSGSKNYSVYSDAFEKIVAGSSSAEEYINCMSDDPNGENCFFAASVSNSGWYLVSTTDKQNMVNFVKQTYIRLNVIVFIILVVFITVSVILSGSFLGPMRNLVEVFREKQKGNVNARFDIKTNDEFREIGVAFNSMFDNIFESEQRYRTIVEMTNNITFEINFKKNSVFVSKNFNNKFSFRPKDDSLKESFIYKLRIHKDDKERYLSDMDRILGPANFIQGEYRVKSIYGDFIWVMIKATKFFDRDETPTKIVGVIVDIDREKKSEIHLLQRASYDNLTQLLNRETFIKSLANRLEASAMKKTLDAMMFIDLDDFKHFNDEYGHACGDEVLKFTADTLKEISFERGFAGRFGGDEFVLCITDLTLYGDAGKIAQEILDILGGGFISESTGERLAIKCSIGIAFLRESGKTTEEIIAAADEAMYNIKKFGKSAYSYAKSVSGKAPQTSASAATDNSGPDIDLFDPLM